MGAPGKAADEAPLLLADLTRGEDRAISDALPARPKMRVQSRRTLRAVLEEQAAALVVLGHELGGPAVCRELRDAGLHAPILYLAPEEAAELEQPVLEAGADDLLLRPVAPERLVLRSQVLLRRRSASGIATVVRSGALEVDYRAYMARLDGRRLALTATEVDLLIHLLRNRDRVVPSDELVREVLPQRSGDPNNARFHIHHVRRKLGDYGKRIEAVRGRGYRWVDPR